MLKKILSSVVAVSFLLNTVSYADALNIKDRSNVSTNTLAPESRLDPTNTPALLDMMKLTAEISHLTSKEEPATRVKAASIELPTTGLSAIEEDYQVTIDKVEAATSHGGVNRLGDEIVFDFRAKVSKGDTTFVSCWIRGIPHGGTAVSTRYYLCVAKKNREFIRLRVCGK